MERPPATSEDFDESRGRVTDDAPPPQDGVWRVSIFVADPKRNCNVRRATGDGATPWTSQGTPGCLRGNSCAHLHSR